jgi:hypothetical protein
VCNFTSARSESWGFAGSRGIAGFGSLRRGLEFGGLSSLWHWYRLVFHVGNGTGEIANNIPGERLEVDLIEIGVGGLQGVEKKPGSLAVYGFVENAAHDLDERALNGVAIFENRQAIARGRSTNAAVKVAEARAA